ncbi:EthD domain-containing protein [Sphingobacterium zeae]|uniref:EthD domain-containing protein n=1 Tax=Sphingobacterium zeae TaxID=1776859 RepID=UPI0036233515
MLLKRNPALTHEAFVKHHIEKHGPLFKQIPEAAEHVIRYLQTHPIKEKSATVKVDDFDSLKPNMVVADGIPNPPMTHFLKSAKEKGCTTLTGLGMLVNQGTIAVKYWTGVDADPLVMH